MDSGFADGEDEIYNVYDQAWRGGKDMVQNIYRPSKNLDKDMYGDDLEARIKTNRYQGWPSVLTSTPVKIKWFIVISLFP